MPFKNTQSPIVELNEAIIIDDMSDHKEPQNDFSDVNCDTSSNVSLFDEDSDTSISSEKSQNTQKYFTDDSQQQEKLNIVVDNLTQELREKYHSRVSDVGVVDPEEKKARILERIEDLFLKLVEDVMQDKPPVLTLRNIRSWDNCRFSQKLSLKPVTDATFTEVKFTHRRSLPKFSLIYLLLGKIYKLLVTNETVTKRELYYQNIDNISSQSLVDNALNDISCLLECPLCDLNIFATSKGLIYGPLMLTTISNNIDCSISKGTLIPDNVSCITKIESHAKFILVIEKDAIFEKLISSNWFDKLPPCLLVTGKGYPDINTRWLLKQLWDALRIPILAIVDPDPWGIEIMCVYRFGSISMSHQSDQLAVPSIRWLGIYPSEINVLCDTYVEILHQDRSKLIDILQRPYVQANKRIHEEIECMLDTGRKSEIEGIQTSNNYLINVYIPQKMLGADFI